MLVALGVDNVGVLELRDEIFAERRDILAPQPVALKDLFIRQPLGLGLAGQLVDAFDSG